MFKRRIFDFIVVTLFCYLLTLNGYYAQNRRQQNRNAQRRSNQNSQTQRSENSLPGYLHESYLDAVGASHQVTPTYAPTTVQYIPDVPRRSRGHRGWGRFAPSVPSLEDADCNVMIELIQRGRCTQLGGNGGNRPFICQSGEHFEFQPECEAKIAIRPNRNPYA